MHSLIFLIREKKKKLLWELWKLCNFWGWKILSKLKKVRNKISLWCCCSEISFRYSTFQICHTNQWYHCHQSALTHYIRMWYELWWMGFSANMTKFLFFFTQSHQMTSNGCCTAETKWGLEWSEDELFKTKL